MTLYKSGDVDLLLNKWDSILSDVEKQKLLLLEPTIEEMRDVYNIILDFVKSLKRKLYGGYALNMLVKDKNPKDAFYKPDKFPDIDFYSPEPIVDLIKLCNIIHKKGYKYVTGREAMHQETYSISVNYMLYCDISYVPRNIYNKMPFKEINGFTLIHPNFMMIDYLRMMTDPLISYWRFESDMKSFRRFVLLQKHYPLPINNNPINISGNTPLLDDAMNNILKFLLNRDTLVVVGFYAYNYLLSESKLLESKKQNNFNILDIPYFEFISTNYREDCLNLLEILKNIITINKDSISYSEFYPFFQFTDHNTEIYLGDDLIAVIYNHNKKCIPYQIVKALKFSNGKIEKINNKTIRIGTFHMTLLYALISIMRARTDNNNDMKNLYYTFSSHLIEMRNNYLTTTKKTFLDDSVFKEFVVNCMGETIQPDRQRRLLIESRKKKNKPYVFTYEPSAGEKEPDNKYMFANSSGNIINNPKNLRLSSKMKEDDVEGDFDDDISDDVSDKNKSTNAK